MGTIGTVKPFLINMASGVTISSYIDIGGSYKNIALKIPSMISTSDVKILTSDSKDGYYAYLYHKPSVNSSTVSWSMVQIPSAVTNALAPLEISQQYVKIELTTAPTATSSNFYLVCGA